MGVVVRSYHLILLCIHGYSFIVLNIPQRKSFSWVKHSRSCAKSGHEMYTFISINNLCYISLYTMTAAKLIHIRQYFLYRLLLVYPLCYRLRLRMCIGSAHYNIYLQILFIKIYVCCYRIWMFHCRHCKTSSQGLENSPWVRFCYVLLSYCKFLHRLIMDHLILN